MIPKNFNWKVWCLLLSSDTDFASSKVKEISDDFVHELCMVASSLFIFSSSNFVDNLQNCGGRRSGLTWWPFGDGLDIDCVEPTVCWIFLCIDRLQLLQNVQLTKQNVTAQIFYLPSDLKNF